MVEDLMNDVFDEFSLVDARDHKQEYTHLFRVYCEELAKEDPTIHQYNFTELAMENLDSMEYDSGLCYIRGSYGEKFWIRLLDRKGYRYDIVKEDEIRDFVHIHLR